MLERLPAGDQIPARLAAALIRLALARRTGDLEAAKAASGRAQALAAQLPGEVHARHPEVEAQVLAGRGVVELWAGDLEEAAAYFAEGATATARAAAYERAGCLGYLALVEALSGRLDRAAERAEAAADAISSGSDVLTEHIIPGAAVALAWVHLQRGDMREAHAQLKLAESALRTGPDKLVSALACMVAAQRGVAGGRATAAVEMIRRAREEWSASPPGWLEARLAVLESRAWTAAGDAAAAVAAAQRAGPGRTPRRRSLTPGWPRETSRPPGVSWTPRARSARTWGWPWPTPGSATAPGTARAVAATWNARCNWPSRSG